MPIGLAGEHPVDGKPDDLQIEQKTGLFSVDQIVVEPFSHFVFVECAAPEPLCLGKAGNAGRHDVPVVVVIKYFIPVKTLLNRVRTGAYKAHVSLKNINNLRQLVQVGFSEKLAEAEYSPVPSLCNHRLAIYRLLFYKMHGPEFKAGKGFTEQPGSFLFKNNGAR